MNKNNCNIMDSTQEIPVELSDSAKERLVHKTKKTKQTFNYTHIEIPNESNIHKYVKKHIPQTIQERRFLARQAISHLNEFEHNDIQYDKTLIEIYISCAISQIKNYIDVMEEFDAKFYLLVKSMFHRYIAELGYIHIITYYNEIFNDNEYDTLIDNKIIPLPVLSIEWQNEKIKEYQSKQLQIERRKQAKRPVYIYKKGAYVGARDKEGKWWLSKILSIFYEGEHVIYYVEFLNWGEQFNEFIVDPNRLRKYNSKLHPLFKQVEIN